MGKDTELIRIYRLHPQGVRFEKAEKTQHGMANPAAVKFCRPFSSCNALGLWLYPPIDFNVKWNGGKDFEHQLLEPWPNTEHDLVKSLVKPSDQVNSNDFCPPQGRSKFTWGSVEEGVMQLWTGCIFKTPPGWCLQLRSPINLYNPDYHVMEGILETDWMQYDIWINVAFHTKNKWIEFRKNQWPPLAQLIPLRRESVDGDWKFEETIANRDDPESEEVFKYWLQYNKKKFSQGGKQYLTKDRTKDSTTFFKERQLLLDKTTNEPIKKTKRLKFIGAKNVHRTCPHTGITEQTSCPFPRTDSAELGENLPSSDNQHE